MNSTFRTAKSVAVWFVDSPSTLFFPCRICGKKAMGSVSRADASRITANWDI